MFIKNDYGVLGCVTRVKTVLIAVITRVRRWCRAILTIALRGVHWSNVFFSGKHSAK